ncbi:hypothetical protein QJS04_geneDACA007092 [Acorus gramineus]|uniref:Uncharacterized protein n=1 Tax=Acorus gramineus TaxID=55184 RepID=A0AAV9BR13_ACOGR|nr:hypothetical protein QJS04_geneDACA007092 [Acorus gramineus]
MKIHHFLHLFYLSIALPPKKPDEKNPSCASKFKKMIIRDDPRLPTSTAQNEKQSKFFEKELPLCFEITRDFFLYPFSGCGKKNNKNPKCIPNVTDLDKIGVRFIPKYQTKTFLDVTFDYQKGVMEIPPLILYPYTQTTLRNIIAFEQCFGGEEDLLHISHYVIMMAFLICTPGDISKLQDEEIITNWLGSQKEVLNVFKQLRGEVVDVSTDHYADVYKKVNQFRLSKFNRHWATLMHDYFGSPWSFLAVLAAFVALVLTFLQTFFTVHTPSHSTG